MPIQASVLSSDHIGNLKRLFYGGIAITQEVGCPRNADKSEVPASSCDRPVE